jgi:hypothetical protein
MRQPSEGWIPGQRITVAVHCSFAYSAFACASTAKSRSASFPQCQKILIGRPQVITTLTPLVDSKRLSGYERSSASLMLGVAYHGAGNLAEVQ